MHHSINRKKIYFYVILFLFLSTSFNFNLLKSFREIGLINSIDIKGLSQNEEMLVKEELKIFLNTNVFFFKQGFNFCKIKSI